MDDLETQLRRYADQVETHVDEVSLPSGGTPQRGSSRRSPILLAAAAVILVLVGAAALLLRDDPETGIAQQLERAESTDDVVASGAVAVPDVVGLDALDARGFLLESGLVTEAEFEPNNEFPANLVFGQDPPAGQRVEPGSTVVLRVSAGVLDTVPSVLGESQESATSILQGLGYTVDVELRPSPQEAGVVVGQVPGAGTALQPGELVTLSVSTGPEVVPIPDVEGLELMAAINLIRDAGFNVAPDQIQEPSGEIEEGRVVRTEPAANSLVAPGTIVTVAVSTGLPTIEVPEVTGLFADTAITTLRNQGLEVTTIFVTVPQGAESTGRVVLQNPAAFEEAAFGSMVTITIGEAPPVTGDLVLIDVPQVTDLFADTAITMLRTQGLEVATIFEVVPIGSVSIGRVLSQSPAPFGQALEGTVITITIGEAAAPANPTTTVGP